MRWAADRYEQHALEVERLACLLGDDEMRVVNRIEDPA
jgi:hypothetical protein